MPADGAGLQAAVRREGDTAVITLSGEADMAGAPVLREALAEAVGAGGGAVVVDMGGVGFLDSTGLAALLNASRRLRRSGRELSLVGLQDAVRQVVRLAHLERDLGVAD